MSEFFVVNAVRQRQRFSSMIASRVSIQRGFTTGGPWGQSGSDMGSRGVPAGLMQEPGSPPSQP